jgi:hypothetical protein
MSAATYTFEVETDVSGSYDAGDSSVGMGPGYEDLDCSGLFALRRSMVNGKFVWTRVDLLAGLPDFARAQVEKNIRKFAGDDALASELSANSSDPVADEADYWRDLRKDEALRGAA